MTKLQIEGKHFSYSILEFTKEDALYYDVIFNSKPSAFGNIHLEDKYHKMLEAIPIVSQFSGFLSNGSSSLKAVGIFTLFRNKKKVFACTLDRLEERYHLGLYKEFCEVNSSVKSSKLKFKKRTGYKYYLLKEERDGIFKSQIDDEVSLKQLVFQHTIIKNNYRSEQFMNVQMNDSIIEFPVEGNPEIKKWLEVIRN
jgi:hypothetical protein